MANFNVARTVVPGWRGTPNLPARPMADQIYDVLEQFDTQKDMRSIGALTQGLRWIDQAGNKDDTLDPKEWQAVSRALQKALGNPTAPISDRADRLYKAFEEEAAAPPRPCL